MVPAILAVCCLVLAIQAVPAGRAERPVREGAGIIWRCSARLRVSGSRAFIFRQYPGRRTQDGVSVSPAESSGSDRLVTLDFTMEDESSVTAVALGSMVIIAGLSTQTPVPAATKLQGAKGPAADNGQQLCVS